MVSLVSGATCVWSGGVLVVWVFTAHRQFPDIRVKFRSLTVWLGCDSFIPVYPRSTREPSFVKIPSPKRTKVQVCLVKVSYQETVSSINQKLVQKFNALNEAVNSLL